MVYCVIIAFYFIYKCILRLHLIKSRKGKIDCLVCLQSFLTCGCFDRRVPYHKEMGGSKDTEMPLRTDIALNTTSENEHMPSNSLIIVNQSVDIIDEESDKRPNRDRVD